jgi:arylsulfatase A-like enzyme
VDRRQFLVRAAAGTASFTLASRLGRAIGPASSAVDRPHILMIVLDDANDWVGWMGGPALTPNLDALAKSSMCFPRAYCSVPMCLQSRVSTLYGIAPWHHGFVSAPLQGYRPGGAFCDEHDLCYDAWREAHVSIVEHLRELGYRTACAGKVFHELTTAQYMRPWDALIAADPVARQALHAAMRERASYERARPVRPPRRQPWNVLEWARVPDDWPLYHDDVAMRA